MQRLSFTLCGLLASCVCSWGSGDVFSVTQSPSTIRLEEGEEEIQINCRWNISIMNPKVNWFKDNQKIQPDQNHNFTEINNSSRCAELVIKHPDVNDAGVYYCEVTQDIPRLITVRGTGTYVKYEGEIGKGTNKSTETTSTASPSADPGSGIELVGSISAVAFILSICLCLSVWRMKRHCRQSERMVIREGPPSEEGEQESNEDGGSTATSRGSTQWYMVPVYESYFDLQRSDELQGADPEDATCASALK